MRTKKGLAVLAVAALPLASLVLLEGTAVAGQTTGTGVVTCHISGTLDFNPPLTPHGTQTGKEIITGSSHLVDCTGGSPHAVPGVTQTKPIKSKGVGKPKIAGACEGTMAPATVKGKQNWTGVKPSKFVLSNVTFGLDGATSEVDETGSAVTTGSYAGHGTVHIDFNSASTTALENCKTGASNAKVSSVTFDEAHSTIGE